MKKIFNYKRKFIFNTYLLGFISLIVFVLSIVLFYSYLSANKKLTYKSKAAECVNGQWLTECLNPKERQSCPNNAGVEQVFLCEGGSWVYKYPQCAVRCAPDASPPSSNADPRCVGQTPGVTIDNCIRKDCDTNIKKMVCIETYCDNNLQFREKPGRETSESCDINKVSCNKGAVIEYCVRQECDNNKGVYVCIETYWDNNCVVAERVGTLTSTSCGNQFTITGQPTIAWPTILPGEGEAPIIISQPTPKVENITVQSTSPYEKDALPTPTVKPSLPPTPGPGWCLWSSKTGLINNECYYCFSPFIAPVKTDLAKCAKVENITVQSTSPYEKDALSDSKEYEKCDFSSLRECRINCDTPNYCTKISNTCYKCFSAQQKTNFIAQRLKITSVKERPEANDVGVGKLVFEVSQGNVGNISQGGCVKNTCCGAASICAGTGLLRLGQAKCQPCGITSEVCINGKCQRAGCQNYGEIKEENGLCFGCFKPYSDKPGEYIAINPKICNEKNEGKRGKIESGEMVTLAIHAEDQYHLRQVGYKKYIYDTPNVGVGEQMIVELMRFGDGLGHAWGNIGAVAQRTWGHITNNEDLKKTEATSSLGNYYVNNMIANVEYEKAHPGERRKVTLGQAIAGGVAGGLDFANKMTFGVLNKVTFGGIAAADRGLMKAAFGEEKEGNYERLAAESARSAGFDLTNTVAFIVPVSKGIGGIGNLATKTGSKLATSGYRPLAVIGQGVEFSGKTISAVSKAVEWTSPERWFTPFIKSAPISTFMETSAKVLSTTKPAVVIGQGAGRITTNIAKKAPVVVKTANSLEKLGKKAFDFLVPRSALTYTEEEAAKFLARDIKLGLVDEAGAVERLTTKYHLSLDKITKPATFIESIEKELQIPAGRIYQKLGIGKNSKIDVLKVTKNLNQEIERINQLDARIAKIIGIQADSTISVDQQKIENYAQKFRNIKDKDELAEAILHEWEKADGKIYVSDTNQLKAAQRYAEEVLNFRSQKSLANRTKTIVTNLSEKIKTRLQSTKKTTIQIPDDLNNLFFNGIKKENVESILDPKTKGILVKMLKKHPDIPIILSKDDIPGFKGKERGGLGQQIFIKSGDGLERIGLSPAPKWHGYEVNSVTNTSYADALVIYVDPDSGIIPRDVTVAHEYGHLIMGHRTVEGLERIDDFVRKYVKNINNTDSQDPIVIIQEIEAEIAGIKEVGKEATKSIRPRKGTYKLQDYLQKWIKFLQDNGADDKTIQTSIREILGDSDLILDVRKPSFFETFMFKGLRRQIIKEIGQNTNISQDNEKLMRRLLWEKGVPYSSLDEQLTLLKKELSQANRETGLFNQTKTITDRQLRDIEFRVKNLLRKQTNFSQLSIENQLRQYGYPEDQIPFAISKIVSEIRPKVKPIKINVSKISPDRKNVSVSIANAPYRQLGEAGQDAASAGNTQAYIRYKYIDAMVAVADGHGKGGHIASQLAIQRFPELFEKYSEILTVKSKTADPITAFRWSIAQLDQEVSQYAGGSGGTTFTAAVRKGDKLYIGYLGDSRLYIIREGKIKLLTKPHNWPKESHKYGIAVSRSLGDIDIKNLARVSGEEGMRDAARFSTPDIITIDVKPEDVILGGSDMLEKMAQQMGGEDQLNKFLLSVISSAPTESVADIIVRHAQELNIQDHMSIAVYKVFSIN